MRRIKLAKDWKAPDGKEYKAGTVLEMDEKSAAACLLDEAGSIDNSATVDIKTASVDIEAKVASAVTKAIEAQIKDLPAKTAKEIHQISVKDMSDEDPSYGYLPNPEKATKSEKLWALGNFAKEVKDAGENLAKPCERLLKCMTRSQERITKAFDAGMIHKTAGDGMTVGADDSLGALIPPTLNTMLLDAAMETAVIRPMATVIPISTLQIQLDKLKDYDRSGGLIYGGLYAVWSAENASLTASQPKHEVISLNLHALHILAYASHQALRFAPFDLGGYLLPKMASAITWKEEDGFINGSGSGMPLGVLNAPAKVELTKQTGQSTTANKLVTANVDQMIARIKIEKMASTCFMYNRPDLYEYLVALSRPVGTGGQMALLYSPISVADSRTAQLCGLPCIDSEHVPAAAAAGAMFITDWSQYIIADDRMGAEIAQSMHLKFDYGQNAYRIIKYVDGQPSNTSAFTRFKGTNTTSSIIAMPSLS